MENWKLLGKKFLVKTFFIGKLENFKYLLHHHFIIISSSFHHHFIIISSSFHHFRQLFFFVFGLVLVWLCVACYSDINSQISASESVRVRVSGNTLCVRFISATPGTGIVTLLLVTGSLWEKVEPGSPKECGRF